MARTVIKLTYILHYRFGNVDHKINCTSEPTDNRCTIAATSGVKHPTYMLWAINTPNHRNVGTAIQFQHLLKSVAQQLIWPIPTAFRSLNSTLVAFSWWQRPAFSYHLDSGQVPSKAKSNLYAIEMAEAANLKQ